MAHDGAPAQSLTGWLMLPAGEGRVRLSPGRVLVRAGKVQAIAEGEREFNAPADFGDEGSLIMPGMVDTHVHLPQFDSIGVGGLELLEWLSRVIFPAEARWRDAAWAGDMSRRVARQLLSFGTTGMAAYVTSSAAGTQLAIDTLGEAGLCGWAGYVLMDQEGPAELLVPAGEALRAGERLRSAGRVRPSLAPRFAVSCSRELLDGVGEFAKSNDWLIQTHLSETHAECEAARRLHGVARYTDAYARSAVLGRRTVLAHGIWLDDEELAAIRDSGSVIAHCPTANRFLRAGTMDRARAVRAGVTVALGSDVAGGPDRSMVRVARAMIEAAQSLGQGGPSASEAWWQITAGNARTIHLNDTGSIAPGQRADLLVVRPGEMWRGGIDPLSTLLYAWDDRWLEHTLCAGKVAWSREDAAGV